jgi:hypothetical protein
MGGLLRDEHVRPQRDRRHATRASRNFYFANGFSATGSSSRPRSGAASPS